MKTKIRSIIAIGVLGFAGVLNANATVNYSRENNSLTGEKISGIINTGENLNEMIDFQKEAQLMTKQTADREEAKALQKVLNLNFNLLNEASGLQQNANNDQIAGFRAEAQAMTRMLADQAEAGVLQKLTEQGKLSENK